MSSGLGSSPDSPFQDRLTKWAATSAFFGRLASSHHWPVKATIPTSICEYMGANFGSKPRALNSEPRMCSTWVAMSLIRLANVPVDVPTPESRTRIRKPSAWFSM